MKHLIAISLLLVACNVGATGTVHDPLNFVQNKLQAAQQQLSNVNERVNNQAQITQIKMLLNTLYELRRQYQQLVYMTESITGKYGYGGYLTGPARFLDPTYHPQSNEEIANQFRQGGGGGTFGTRTNTWRNKYAPPDRHTDYPDDPDSPEAHNFEDRSHAAMGLGVSSEVVYDAITERSKTIDALSKQIDQTENIKQSLDLNNAFLAEMSVLLNDILRLQTLQAKAQSVDLQQGVNQDRRDRQFNRLP